MRVRKSVTSRRLILRNEFCVLLTAGLLAISGMGCGGGDVGPARVAVEGVVTLDGQKLAAGVVKFIPTATGKNVGPAVLATITNGEFRLPSSEGPVIGRHRVEIESTGHYGFDIDDEAAYAKLFQEKKGQPVPPNPIPENYNAQSTLTEEVKADGPNKFEFQLQRTRSFQPAR